MRDKFTQVCNPITRRFVLIDKTIGSVVKIKRTKGPYKGIPIRGERYDLKEQK